MARTIECRVCGSPLTDIHTIYNMPKAVQNLCATPSLAREAQIDINIRQCSACGLIQLANDPVPYYKEVIRAGGGSESMKRRQHLAFQNFLNFYLLQDSKVVEIGVGKGEYLSILKFLGVNAVGLEGYPSDLDPKPEYDAFVCINFLEHTPDPNAFLRSVAKMLKETGVGMISVPDFANELAESYTFTFISDHLLYFTVETLRTLLTLNGFIVDTVFRNEDLNVLTAYVRKRPLLNLSKAMHNFHETIEDLDVATIIGSMAVWGASHHAFSILASPQLAGKVSYIVDSAPFKQSKFAPVSGLAIYPPDHLLHEPVDVVVIISPEYSQEIYNIIDSTYPIKNVATFIEGKFKWLK